MAHTIRAIQPPVKNRESKLILCGLKWEATRRGKPRLTRDMLLVVPVLGNIILGRKMKKAEPFLMKFIICLKIVFQCLKTYKKTWFNRTSWSLKLKVIFKGSCKRSCRIELWLNFGRQIEYLCQFLASL